MIAEGELFAVVVVTRNRPAAIMRLLDALERQSDGGFHTVVVDQSDATDPALEARAGASPALHLVQDDGRGTSRARNIGWRNVGAHWVAFLDDDTPPDDDWAQHLRAELEPDPEVDMISGPVAAHAPNGHYTTLGSFNVEEPRVLAGRWIRPGWVAGGIGTVRRTTIARLGGWDERLGPGTPDFPACEDMDFNYRLTRAGGRVYLTPRVRVSHDQWRSQDEVVSVHAGYNRAWGGLVVKQLKTGDPLGAAMLTGGRVWGITKLVGRSLRSRSAGGLRLARVQIGGFLRGAVRALRRNW